MNSPIKSKSPEIMKQRSLLNKINRLDSVIIKKSEEKYFKSKISRIKSSTFKNNLSREDSITPNSRRKRPSIFLKSQNQVNQSLIQNYVRATYLDFKTKHMSMFIFNLSIFYDTYQKLQIMFSCF